MFNSFEFIWKTRGLFGSTPQIATPNVRLATLILAGVWFTVKIWHATATKPSCHRFCERKCGGRFCRHNTRGAPQPFLLDLASSVKLAAPHSRCAWSTARPGAAPRRLRARPPR
ncbi:hypothetical protein PVAP13_7NG045500 [Panicum virgatum]|uniref:Uncharacterized protein n=1 Tax=Panicum virgatum TaxID=38727 RepID=A0A8T0PRC9_PANVG|nr:hypothetical protein PVAP13_7NG045500 [Panicum virgatum]